MRKLTTTIFLNALLHGAFATTAWGQMAHNRDNPDDSNVLCLKSGAKVIEVSSLSPQAFAANNIISDSLGQDVFWRISNKNKFPHWVIIELPEVQHITTMQVSTHSLSEAQCEGITASVLAVEFSTESPEKGYKQVAREFLQKQKQDQIFNIKADSAKWIKIIVENNFKCSAFTELGRVYAYDDFTLNRFEMAFQNDGKLEVYGIHFEENSAELTQESLPTIETVASIIRQNPEWEILVEGHTDSTGDNASNLTLSKERAASVKDKLIELGLAADKLTAEGYGETMPLFAGNNEAEKAKNRRVTFRIKEYQTLSSE